MPDEEELPQTAGEQQEEAVQGQAEEAPSIEELQAQLEEADRERVQFRTMAQRTQADLTNYRRRVEEEREELYHAIGARFITKLLPIVDDLQRALDHVPASSEEASWLEGMRLIERSLQSLLESEGVTPIETEGVVFDPHEHEALFAIEDPSKEPGTVATVIRPGYKLHGKVLRATQVVVAQAPEQEKQEQPPAEEAGDSQEREEQ